MFMFRLQGPKVDTLGDDEREEEGKKGQEHDERLLQDRARVELVGNFDVAMLSLGRDSAIDFKCWLAGVVEEPE